MVLLKEPLGCIRRFVIKHQDGLGVMLLIMFTLTLFNHSYITSYRRYFVSLETQGAFPEVVIVLGGGIKDGKPKPILKGRLDTAVALFEAGKIKIILVSGDNRSDDYNEPEVMRDYLVNEKGLPSEQIYLDNAGRSTYETCERAVKVFGFTQAILVSEATHLPRAIYLCRTFGLDSYGVPSQAEVAKGLRIGQRWREFQASQKAFINVHIIGEHTVLGDKIDVR